MRTGCDKRGANKGQTLRKTARDERRSEAVKLCLLWQKKQ
jgi:hypothetical protein